MAIAKLTCPKPVWFRGVKILIDVRESEMAYVEKMARSNGLKQSEFTRSCLNPKKKIPGRIYA